MAGEELLDRLQSMGLTQYQAKGYRAAVRLGSGSPTELSEESDVPQARIYDVIDDLQEMGLVEIQEQSGGKQVTAPPPEIVLEDFQQRRIDQFTGTVQDALDDLEQLHEGQSSTDEFVTMVGLRESALRHARRAIDEAEWWLSLALPQSMYEDLEPEIVSALDRGVTVRLVIPAEDSPDDDAFPDELAVRQRTLRDRLVVADRHYGVFSSASPQEGSPSYVITRQSELTFLLQNFFQEFWPGSERVQAGSSFPRRYLDPWRTVIDLREAIDDGEALQATVTGYRATEDRVGTWTGPLVDYELDGPVDADYSVVMPTEASLSVEIDGERQEIGGQKAFLADIAAEGIEISRVDPNA